MSESVKAGDPVPVRWRKWFHDDRQHTSAWRKEAIKAFDFVAGRQWSPEDQAKLRAELRPAITFNRTAVIVDAVSGNEMQSRQEIRYLPREQGDALPNEILSEAARWFDDESDAEDEDSEAFFDAMVCGMGWTESRLDFDEDPDGQPLTEKIDPIEMWWDAGARRSNLKDARRLWRVKVFTQDEVSERWPDIAKSDLDASHWTETTDKTLNTNNPIDRYEDEPDSEDGGFSEDSLRKTYRIAHLQYWTREDYYKVADPLGGDIVDMDADQFKETEKKMAAFGIALKGVKLTRKKFMQAFVGNVVLEHGPGGCDKHFTWKCITAKFDRGKGYWFGMVRAMIGPQEWSNKWLSQLLHIMNSNSSGGVDYETGAFANISKAQQDWAKPNAMIEYAPGALAAGKVQRRDPQAMPTGLQALTEYAVSAIRDVTGVSLELLGMREATQAGVLEYQRRQSGMTVLAPLFNALRRYRKDRGRLLLYYITEHLSDGRLIRIVGEAGQKYVPLVKQADAKYDVIIDEAPTSPNQKEQIWQTMMQVLPGIKDMIPPEVMLQLLEYSPVPSSVVEKIKGIITAKGPEQEKQAQMAAQAALFELQQKQADITLSGAQAAETMADAKLKEAKAVTEVAGIEQKHMAEQMAKTQELVNITLKQAEIDDKREKATAEGEDRRLKMQMDSEAKLSDLAQRQQESAEKTLLALAQEMTRQEEMRNKPKKVVYDENDRVIGVE